MRREQLRCPSSCRAGDAAAPRPYEVRKDDQSLFYVHDAPGPAINAQANVAKEIDDMKFEEFFRVDIGQAANRPTGGSHNLSQCTQTA